MLSARRTQRRPGPAEEDAPAPDHRRQREEQARPAEERGELGLHPVEHAAVESECDRHDIARHRAGKADARERDAILAAAHLLGAHSAARMRRIAERAELARDRRQAHHAGSHRTSTCERDRSSRASTTPGSRPGQLLHQPDAGAAVDALEVELRGQEPVRPAPAGARLKAGIVQLGIAPIARAGRRPRRARGALPVEAVLVGAAVLVDEGVDRPTARAAELAGCARLEQSRGHGQAALRARRRGDPRPDLFSEEHGDGRPRP
jgi:hypothetical protein